MRDYKKIFRKFCLRAVCALLLAFVFCFCSTTLAGYLRPRITTSYVLAADEKGGEYIYKTTGILDYAGRLCDIVLGGSFTNSAALSAVSGNFSFDEEHQSYIEDMPLAPDKNGQPVIEKTVSSGGGVAINNETSYNVDAKGISTSPAFKLEKGGPHVLIVHSHATESYTPTEKYNFRHSSLDRTTDKKYNMVRIGEELKSELEKKGVECIHLTDLFDYPEYNNSYSRSCAAVEAAIAKNPQIKIVLDLHRDSIINSEGTKTKVTTTINGEKVAQVMLVVGTDELGLKHDGWQTNLRFASHLQKLLLKEEENFARPINLRTSRFNGHTAPGAVIIEVGTGGNTIEEAISSVKYIANALEKLVKSYE